MSLIWSPGRCQFQSSYSSRDKRVRYHSGLSRGSIRTQPTSAFVRNRPCSFTASPWLWISRMYSQWVRFSFKLLATSCVAHIQSFFFWVWISGLAGQLLIWFFSSDRSDNFTNQPDSGFYPVGRNWGKTKAKAVFRRTFRQKKPITGFKNNWLLGRLNF